MYLWAHTPVSLWDCECSLFQFYLGLRSQYLFPVHRDYIDVLSCTRAELDSFITFTANFLPSVLTVQHAKQMFQLYFATYNNKPKQTKIIVNKALATSHPLSLSLLSFPLFWGWGWRRIRFPMVAGLYPTCLHPTSLCTQQIIVHSFWHIPKDCTTGYIFTSPLALHRNCSLWHYGWSLCSHQAMSFMHSLATASNAIFVLFFPSHQSILGPNYSFQEKQWFTCISC